MIDSIPARLLARGRAHGEAPAYSVRQDNGTWTPTPYRQYSQQVQDVCRSLVKLGFNAGDTTAILGFNRPEWVVFDVATMMAGGAPAGIYTTCSPSEVQYILHHSGSGFALLEDANQWGKVLAELENLPDLRHVIMMKGAEDIEHELVMSWDDFIACGQDVDENVIEERLNLLEADQIATFIYTSGTTGPPKAVMLSHKNLTWTADKAAKISTMQADDTSVSYLPLSHIAEQMFSIHAPITMGSSIYFAESIERVADNLKEVQPSVLFGVPRIWEKMHAKVSAKMAEATGVKAKILSWSMKVGRASSDLRNRGASPGLLFSLKHKMAHRLLFSKIKPLMGLANARMCVTGAAPISAEILEWFAGLDVTIHEVYGQSEDCGPTSFNLIGQTRFGTVGPALEGTEVRIADDGEICVRGPHVFLGYYKDQAATDEALIDGWLHSGDLGSFDADGYLTITGRKKEIIITAGGKNIAPKNIEAALKNLPIVSQAVVIGDRRKFLSALITLDPEAAEAWAEAHSLPLEGIHAHPQLIQAIDADIESKVNTLFARVEHVRKFTVLERDFSIDHGELTPTLKIKRSPINENWSDTIEAMYV